MGEQTIKQKRRLNILSIPVDLLNPEEIEERLDELIKDGGQHQIVLLSLWDLIRARGRSAFARAVRTASLVIPSSKTIVRIAWILRRRQVPRYLPFDFVIKILAALESKQRSVYLIGSRAGALQTATANVRGSFPHLHIVGRCAGYFPAEDEDNIILAIRKAAPVLILAGNGVPGRDKWLLVHRERFSPGLTLWCGDCIEMFAGRKRRTNRDLWHRGLDFLPELLRKPWRAYRIFVYLWLGVLVTYYRIKKL